MRRPPVGRIAPRPYAPWASTEEGICYLWPFSNLSAWGNSYLRISRRKAFGVRTAIPKRPAALRKSRRLLVTIASACPLIATSKTMSSFGSGDKGRWLTDTNTGIATDSTASITVSTSPRDLPAASRCSGRNATSRYSHTSLKSKSSSTSRLRTRRTISAAAPLLERKALINAAVSRTIRTVR